MFVVQGQHGLRVVEVCAFAATNLLSLRGMPCRCSPFVSMVICGAPLPKRGVPSSEHHSVHHLGRKAALQRNVWTSSIHRVIRTDPVHYVSLGVWIHIYWFFVAGNGPLVFQNGGAILDPLFWSSVLFSYHSEHKRGSILAPLFGVRRAQFLSRRGGSRIHVVGSCT